VQLTKHRDRSGSTDRTDRRDRPRKRASGRMRVEVSPSALGSIENPRRGLGGTLRRSMRSMRASGGGLWRSASTNSFTRAPSISSNTPRRHCARNVPRQLPREAVARRAENRRPAPRRALSREGAARGGVALSWLVISSFSPSRDVRLRGRRRAARPRARRKTPACFAGLRRNDQGLQID